MRNHGSLLSALALVLAAGLGGSSSAHATNYRDFCGSVPRACTFTGPDAPVLAAVVCWSSSTSTATLMTGATCPTGRWPYFVKYGLVDPMSLSVSAFVPLDDACSRPGLCQPTEFKPANTTNAPICCFGGNCWPINDDLCPSGEIYFCFDGVSNDDGTVTCFEGEPL
jgi:hypothetical protein